jgi:hypothetical protein
VISGRRAGPKKEYWSYAAFKPHHSITPLPLREV